MVFSLGALLVDLSLLCADEGFLVDVRMDFNVRVVGELQRVLQHTYVYTQPKCTARCACGQYIPICYSPQAWCGRGGVTVSSTQSPFVCRVANNGQADR